MPTQTERAVMSANQWGWFGSVGLIGLFGYVFLSTRTAELADGTRNGPATMADVRAFWIILGFVGLYCLLKLTGITGAPMGWIAVPLAALGAIALADSGPDVRGDAGPEASAIHSTFDSVEDTFDRWLE